MVWIFSIVFLLTRVDLRAAALFRTAAGTATIILACFAGAGWGWGSMDRFGFAVDLRRAAEGWGTGSLVARPRFALLDLAALGFGLSVGAGVVWSLIFPCFIGDRQINPVRVASTKRGKLVEPTGFEPATFSLRTRRSTN